MGEAAEPSVIGAGSLGPSARPPEPAADAHRLVAVCLIALLPAAHLLILPVGGALAGGADAVVAFALLTGAALFLAGGVPAFRAEIDVPYLLLLAFAAFAATSGLWSATPAYAVVKGAGYAGLAAAAWFLARSGLPWERAADAWLLGTALSLALAAVGVVLLVLTGGGTDAGPLALLGERVVYRGGAVQGIGFPRLRGPFSHPNLFGEHLVVSTVFLWFRREAWVGGLAGAGRRPVGWALAAGILLAMVAAVPSAWVAMGPLVVALGWSRLGAARRAGEAAGGWPRVLAWGAVLAGGALTLAAALGLLVPMEVAVGPLSVSTNGIRPRMWGAALATLVESPIFGVGGTPFPARLPANADGVVGLWEAHSLYLGVVAQFGLVGAALLGGAVVVLVRGVLRGNADPIASRLGAPRPVAPHSVASHPGAMATLFALGAVGVHGVFSGSEDFRHVWLLFGIMGIVISESERG